MALLKYILFTVMIMSALSQHSDFLQDSKELASLLESADERLPRTIDNKCLKEILAMKSLFFSIINSNGVDEIIFFTLKDLVNHFPGLKTNCKMFFLPKIDTSKWDVEKFKSLHFSYK
jgi:hypothetical protein